MVMRKASADTDQIARSLLQKAVRRGCVDVAKATFWFLSSDKEEYNWIRSRLAVITFEEAWPYGTNVTFSKTEAENLHHITTLCSIEKQKDAAGLGSLAYAFSEGDQTVLQGDDSDWYIKVVAKALREKDKFRAWAQSESDKLDSDRALLVSNAIAGSKKAGWPWDKAFTYAAALLAIKQPVPIIRESSTIPSRDFPFWIAIDKHTQEGKIAIRDAAQQIGVSSKTALWLSFYFESAICRNLLGSPWWDREKRWRMSKLNMSDSEGQKTWQRLQPIVKEHLATHANSLAERIYSNTHAHLPGGMIQQEFFRGV